MFDPVILSPFKEIELFSMYVKDEIGFFFYFFFHQLLVVLGLFPDDAWSSHYILANFIELQERVLLWRHIRLDQLEIRVFDLVGKLDFGLIGACSEDCVALVHEVEAS